MEEPILIGDTDVVLPHFGDHPDVTKGTAAGPWVNNQGAEHGWDVPAIFPCDNRDAISGFQVVDMGYVNQVGCTVDVGKDKVGHVKEPSASVLHALPLVPTYKMVDVGSP